MMNKTGNEPELQGARAGMTKLYVYVMTDPDSHQFEYDLLDIVGSVEEAERLIVGWLKANHPDKWEMNGSQHVWLDSLPGDKVAAMWINNDLYKGTAQRLYNMWLDEREPECRQRRANEYNEGIERDAQLVASIATIDEIQTDNTDLDARFSAAGGDLGAHSGASWSAVCARARQILAERQSSS